MKLQSKDSKKFLAVSNDGKISLQTIGYELKIIKDNPNDDFFFLVPLEELKKENPLCITPSTINDGSPLILEKINFSKESQLWKFENNYFINKELKEGKKMCIDVCCEKRDDNTDIIIYHIKNPKKAHNINNQLWEIK